MVDVSQLCVVMFFVDHIMCVIIKYVTLAEHKWFYTRFFDFIADNAIAAQMTSYLTIYTNELNVCLVVHCVTILFKT